MTRFDLLIQLDVSLASEIIFDLAGKFNCVEELHRHLCGEVTEEELQQINDAARKEGRQPLSFFFTDNELTVLNKMISIALLSGKIKFDENTESVHKKVTQEIQKRLEPDKKLDRRWKG